MVQNRLVFPAVTPDQDQSRRLGAHRLLQAAPDRQQEGQVLARLDRADVQEIGAGGRDGGAAGEGAFQPQVGDVDRRGGQVRPRGEAAQFIRRILGVDDDARGVAQHVLHAPLMLGPVAGTAELGVRHRDQIVDHDDPLDAAMRQGGQDVRRIQTGVADVDIGARRRRGGDAARTEILFPHPRRLLARLGSFLRGAADDRSPVLGRAQGVEQSTGLAVQFGHGAGAGPAHPKLGQALAEPVVVDAGQLILARPHRRHPIDRMFDQPFGISQTDPVHARRRAAFSPAEQSTGVEEHVLHHQETYPACISSAM